jgi:flagellar hook-associated protein 3 FlgL
VDPAAERSVLTHEEHLVSGSVGTASQSDYSLLGNLLADSSVVRRRLNLLTNQASSGLVGNTYAGLGAGAPTSLSLRPQIGNLKTWQSNIDAANGQMSVTQAATTQIQAIAADFYSQLTNMQGVNAIAVDSIAATARDALSQIAGLLDTQDGGVYVFAAQDTANEPVLDPNSIADIVANPAGYFAQISGAVANLGGVGAAATALATYNIAISNTGGTSPFSPYMSQASAVLQAQVPIVQVGQRTTRNVGLLASANALIPDSVPGTPVFPAVPTTTGSYMRDILRALATVGSLTSAQASLPGYNDLVQDIRTSLSGAINAMACDVGVLGNTQSSLASTQTQLSDTEIALTGPVSSVEDVDMAQTLSQLSLVQTQLQGSYQVMAAVSGLSLVKFLPVG